MAKQTNDNESNNDKPKIKWPKVNWLHVFFIVFPIALLLIAKYLLCDDKYFTYSALGLGILAFLYFILVDYSGKKRDVPGKDTTEKSRNRTFLTIWIVTAGLVVIVGFGLLLAMDYCEGDVDCVDTAETTFNIIVPIIASWIGTVLAFYFGRENFESATDRLLQLTKESLDDLPVEQMMISVRTMLFQKLDGSKFLNSSGTNPKEKIHEIIKFYDDVAKDRIPILDKDHKPLYIIHLSVLKNLTDRDQNLKEFLDKKDNKKLYRHNTEQGFITVESNLSLEEATRRRLQIEGCRDIFVTSDGTADGKVQGWITDSLATRFLSMKK